MSGMLGAALLGTLLGIAAGAVFFGGLARTLARLPGARRPGLLVAGSLLLRLTVMGATLLVLARWLPPTGVLGAAVGVLVARTVLVRAAASATDGPGHTAGTEPLGRR